MSTLEKIKQYCRRLEKHSDDKLVLKETLHKLNKMEVTVDILQETGIGKIVSSIKKRGDTAGVMATDLIRKWRKVVDREAEMENPPPADAADSDEPMQLEDIKDRKPVYEDAKAHHHQQRSEKVKEEKCGSEKREPDHKSSSLSSSRLSSSKHNKYSSERAPEPELFSDAVVAIKKEIKEELSQRHSTKDSSNRNSSGSSSSNSKSEDRKSQHGHHSDHEKEDRRRSHKDEQRNHHKDRSQHKSHHSRSAEATPKDVTEIKREIQVAPEVAPLVKSERRSEGHRSDESKMSKSSCSAVDDSAQVKQEPCSSKDKQRRDRKRKATEGADELEVEADGMNENFGTFEDCLGSIEPKKHKKKRKLNGNKPSAAASPKMTVTSSTLNGSINKPKGPRLPDLLDSKKATEHTQDRLPIPQLVTDYKPLPRLEPKPSASSSSVGVKAVGAASQRGMTNEEAVLFTSSRKDRTAVYSGRKQHMLSSVPTLYEACVRVLTDHVDLIDETGGVPYDIMRPIMERCSWQQLERLEYYNPYLTEDSDPLWEAHVKRDFRGKIPAKGEETWRELYMRCHDAREQKLRDLKESIGQSMKAKQEPVRKTKLAYVDTMAKPPRNVQRAQLKHGTHLANRAQPSQARSIAAKASTSAAIEPVRAPASAAKKPNKPAPLMAKTLSFLKMRKATGYGFASR